MQLSNHGKPRVKQLKNILVKQQFKILFFAVHVTTLKFNCYKGALVA